MPELKPGDPRRLGDYEIVARLGEGGQGVVYLGRTADGTNVAVKLLRADLAEDDAARSRFVREVQVATQVARFCTAQVIEADVAGDRPFIVSEYVPGPSLQRQVTEEGPRTGAALERLAVGTATALVAIHQAGIVHRDFKPHNVLIGPDGPRVIDFGIARALDVNATSSTGAIGTPAYMAPEQIMGRTLSPSVDTFSWASTMVFASTGTPPFGQDSIPAVINRILNEEPDLSRVPDDLRELMRACLAKDPSGRPKAQDLLMSLLGQDGVTPPAGAQPTAVMAAGAADAAVDTTRREGPGGAGAAGAAGAAGLAAAGAAGMGAPAAGEAATARLDAVGQDLAPTRIGAPPGAVTGGPGATLAGAEGPPTIGGTGQGGGDGRGGGGPGRSRLPMIAMVAGAVLAMLLVAGLIIALRGGDKPAKRVTPTSAPTTAGSSAPESQAPPPPPTYHRPTYRPSTPASEPPASTPAPSPPSTPSAHETPATKPTSSSGTGSGGSGGSGGGGSTGGSGSGSGLGGSGSGGSGSGGSGGGTTGGGTGAGG